MADRAPPPHLLLQVGRLPLALPRGANAFAWVCVDGSPVTAAGACPAQAAWATVLASAGCAPNGTDCYALLRVLAQDGSVAAENPQLLAVPGRLAFPSAAVTVQVAGAPNADGSIDVAVQSTATALYVTLTAAAAGRFAPNVFMMQGAGNATVRFLPFAGAGPADPALLAETLRVDHVALYSTRAEA